MDEMSKRKNPAAVALGRMGRGVARQFTPEQLAAAAERLAAGRAKRWPKKTETVKQCEDKETGEEG